jgi:hypothetical protein
LLCAATFAVPVYYTLLGAESQEHVRQQLRELATLNGTARLDDRFCPICGEEVCGRSPQRPCSVVYIRRSGAGVPGALALGLQANAGTVGYYDRSGPSRVCVIT